jgi:hypothetical protein
MGVSSVSGVTFRIVTAESDAKSIIDLARINHSETWLSGVEFSELKVQRMVEKGLKDPAHQGGFLALKNGQAIGFAYCVIGEWAFATGALLTTIHALYVRRDVRESLSGGRAAVGLLTGVATWSKARGARDISFHVTSGVDLTRTHKFIKSMGFDFVGGNYVRHLKN